MIEQLRKKLLELNIFDENEYLDNYINLIYNNINTKYKKFYTQKHHIIPKNVIIYLGLGDEYNQTINLNYSDHILAHYYLCLASKVDYIFAANYKSIKWICSNCFSWKTNNELKEKLKEQLPAVIKNLPLYNDIHRKAMIIISKTVSGRVLIHKGEKHKYIDKKDVAYFLDNDWQLGMSLTRVNTIYKARKGYKLSEQAKKNISEGHKGVPSGMKGKKHSEDTLRLLRVKHSGINNGMYGRHHTAEVRKKLSELKKDNIDTNTIKEICSDFNTMTINKIRKKHHMSAKKVMRVLLENNLITKDEYLSKYKV